MTSNRCIPVKITLGRNVIVSCECELILLLSVVFCLVTAMHTFTFSLVIDWILTDIGQWKVRGAVTEVYVIYVTFSPQNLLGNKRLYSRCQGQNFSRRSRTVWHPHYLQFAAEEFKLLRSECRPDLCCHMCTKALSAKRILLLLSEASLYHEVDLFSGLLCGYFP
jgi:hypothetical protein